MSLPNNNFIGLGAYDDSSDEADSDTENSDLDTKNNGVDSEDEIRVSGTFEC